MSKPTSVTDQVNTAIANAHKNINSASQLAPADESQLFQMSQDIQERLDDLNKAQVVLSGFLEKHRSKQPTYS